MKLHTQRSIDIFQIFDINTFTMREKKEEEKENFINDSLYNFLP